MVSTFEEKLLSLSKLECGCYEKSTGKHRIENDKDLDAMYRGFSENDEITLWCEGKQNKDSGKKSSRKRKSDERGPWKCT